MPEPTWPREIEIYEDAQGHRPFEQWLNTIRDRTTQARIDRRIDRMRQGNFGDHKGVGEGVFELRLAFGPGYRVYYTEVGTRIVLLLCGGDKRRQRRDIERAKAYWNDYKERTK